MNQLNSLRIEELRKLCHIPWNDGEQFIAVDLNLSSMVSGTIRFGFGYKLEMGELDFSTIEEAIEIVKWLRKKANMVNIYESISDN
jgi:hypothetical protein